MRAPLSLPQPQSAVRNIAPLNMGEDWKLLIAGKYVMSCYIIILTWINSGRKLYLRSEGLTLLYILVLDVADT